MSNIEPIKEKKAVVQTGNRVMPLIPTDMDTAFRMASAFAMSGMLPKSYNGDIESKKMQAFTAMQLGAEVGLLPMQAIQNIAVINGMPSIWGDSQLGLCRTSSVCEYVKEKYVGEWQGKQQTNKVFKAVCIVKRIGQDEEIIEEFSIQDAIDAGLWPKSGPWTQYPKRMLKYRARAFALRDAFPDILKGLTHSAEELQDITLTQNKKIDVTHSTENLSVSDLNNVIYGNGSGQETVTDVTGIIEISEDGEILESTEKPKPKITIGSAVTKGNKLISDLNSHESNAEREAIFNVANGHQIIKILEGSGHNHVSSKINKLMENVH